MRNSSFLRASLALLALAMAATTAEAQLERGVVLDFSGRGSGGARNAVVRAASEKLDLQRSSDAEDAARNIGADLSQPAGIAAVAQDQGLTLVITGEVTGRGRRARTHIHVYDDQGNEVAYREAGRPTGRANQRRISAAAVEAIDQALGAVQQRRQEEALARQRAEEEDRRRMAALAAEHDARQAEEEEDEVPENALPLISAFIGIDGRNRNAEATFTSGGGRGYDLGLYPELSLRLESFPLGRSASAARGIYAQVDLAFALALSSQELQADGTPGPEIDTSAWRMLIQAGYQYPLDDDSFRIGALLGFGIESFTIGDNSVLASTRYSFLRLGVVGDARLYEQLLRLRVDFGYRIVFGVGDIADPAADPNALGSEASGGAFDVGASLGGHLAMGLAYGLRFGFTRYSFDFSGDAGDPEAVGSSFTDKGINLSVQIGYAY
ncbi:MAG: hypothetical protein CMN30_15925 [Sandaracinus sp.]|nr:hypothetical protein [Sandaracinus sp.]